MKHLLLILLLLPLELMAQELPKHKKPVRTMDKEIYDLTRNNGTAITYESPAEMQVNFEKESRLNLWTDQDKQTKQSELPEGGRLRFGVSRKVEKAAHADQFTVLVLNEKGEEVLRKTLEHSPPSSISAAGVTIWQNLVIIPLSDPLKTGYTIYVIDNLFKRRHEYLVKLD